MLPEISIKGFGQHIFLYSDDIANVEKNLSKGVMLNLNQQNNFSLIKDEKVIKIRDFLAVEKSIELNRFYCICISSFFL